MLLLEGINFHLFIIYSSILFFFLFHIWALKGPLVPLEWWSTLRKKHCRERGVTDSCSELYIMKTAVTGHTHTSFKTTWLTQLTIFAKEATVHNYWLRLHTTATEWRTILMITLCSHAKVVSIRQKSVVELMSVNSRPLIPPTYSSNLRHSYASW